MRHTCGEKFVHNGITYYVGWMRSNEHGMWINEQPNGGFRWEFLDYEPGDNYTKIYIAACDPRTASSENDSTTNDTENSMEACDS